MSPVMPEDGRGDDAIDPVAVHAQYAVLYFPIITKMGEHQWRAQYPGLEWFVLTEREEDVADALSTEAQRRHDAGAPDAQPPLDLLARHLDQAIPGMSALDRELFLYVRTQVGVDETQRAFQEAERRRAAGRSYTLGDYLAERGQS